MEFFLGFVKNTSLHGDGGAYAEEKPGRFTRLLTSQMPVKSIKKPILLGVIASVCWMLCSSAGILIDSSPYRKVLLAPEDQQPGFWDTLLNFFPAMLLYTPTNAAILSCLAGFVGGCASNVVIGRKEIEKLLLPSAEFKDSNPVRRQILYMAEPPFLSFLRGFVVYLTFIAGILVAVENSFESAGSVQFMRYAGFISLVAFGMGYNPTRFETLISSIPVLGKSDTDKKS